MNTTTRKFSRTLNEAFPGGTEYAKAVEHYRRTDTSGITIVLVVGLVTVIALVGSWMGGML